MGLAMMPEPPSRWAKPGEAMHVYDVASVSLASGKVVVHLGTCRHLQIVPPCGARSSRYRVLFARQGAWVLLKR